MMPYIEDIQESRHKAPRKGANHQRVDLWKTAKNQPTLCVYWVNHMHITPHPPPSRPGWGGGYPGYPPPSRPDWGGYPRYPPTIQTWLGYPPPLGWGTPLPRPGMGYPPHHLDLFGVPPYPDLVGVPLPTPDLRWGIPHPRPEIWHPPSTIQTWTGYLPPSPRKCEQTENITFPHPSDAGGNEAIIWIGQNHSCMN